MYKKENRVGKSKEQGHPHPTALIGELEGRGKGGEGSVGGWVVLV